MPPPPEFSPDPPDSREVFRRSLSPPLLHLEMVFYFSILVFNKPSYKRNEPALITDEGNLLMCWDPGIAIGLVASPLPLLLLEVEVKVLLQVVRVELPLR